jgi:hypothetical protein
MKKRRKLIALPKLRAFLAISLTLAIVSAHGESRASKATEGELAVELFGLIAEQSGCSRYVVAWLESVTQQINSRCAQSVAEFERIKFGARVSTRFFVDVPKAKIDFRNQLSSTSLPRSTAVLAYLLKNSRERQRKRDQATPLLVYQNPGRSKPTSDPNGRFAFSESPSESMIVVGAK